MGDKHLYDRKGNYVGRVSDEGPSSSRSDRHEDRTTLIAVVLAVFGAVGGYLMVTGDSLGDRIFVPIVFAFIFWFIGLGIGTLIKFIKGA